MHNHRFFGYQRMYAWFCLLLISGCGYHLVGQGSGNSVIPRDTPLSVQADSAAAQPLARSLAERLAQRGYQLAVADSKSGVVLRITQVIAQLRPVAYDASGLAVQYRLTLTGDVILHHEGSSEPLWVSHGISEQGDIFASGGPTEVDAQRSRVMEQLRQQWVQKALAQLLSGF